MDQTSPDKLDIHEYLTKIASDAMYQMQNEMGFQNRLGPWNHVSVKRVMK